MIGRPKYRYGDVVEFKIKTKEGDSSRNGVIAIIDSYGTFFDDSDVSYDILNKDENILYKHVREDYVARKIDEVDPDHIWDR